MAMTPEQTQQVYGKVIATLWIYANPPTITISTTNALGALLGATPSFISTPGPLTAVGKIVFSVDGLGNLLYSYTTYGLTIDKIVSAPLPNANPPGGPLIPGGGGPATLAPTTAPVLTAPYNNLVVASGGSPGDTTLTVTVQSTVPALAVGGAVNFAYLDQSIAAFTITSIMLSSQTDQAGFVPSQLIVVGLSGPLTQNVLLNTGVLVASSP